MISEISEAGKSVNKVAKVMTEWFVDNWVIWHEKNTKLQGKDPWVNTYATGSRMGELMTVL